MQPQNEKGWMKDSEEIREKRDKDAKKNSVETQNREEQKNNQREIMWEKVHHKGKAAAEG